MLTIHNFENHISSIVLQRGKQYYSKGYVIDLEPNGDDEWEAVVEGSDTYTVTITLKKNKEIKNYSCDCPVSGDTCKHIVAVFFALREEIKIVTANKPGKALKKDVFEHLLQSINVKEYQGFIRAYAAGNRKFKTEFELFFADKDKRVDVEKKYGELVQKLIRKYSNGRYVDYRASSGLSKEVNMLLQKGSEYIGKNNFRDAFSLAKAVLKPIMGTIEYCDDSSGSIGDSTFNTINLLETIAISDIAAIDIKEQLLDYIQTELNDKLYFDYGDFGYSLFSIFQNLAVQLMKHELFLNFVNTQMPILTKEHELDRKEYFQKSMISFLQQTGKNEAARALVQQNMHIVEVRLEEVNKTIKKKDFNTAKKLIADGIAIAEANRHPGTVNQWQKELLRVAVLQNDIATVRRYTKHFAFDQWFSSEYYRQWKATFTATEWRGEIEKHIEKTIQQITKEWKTSRKTFRSATHPRVLEHLASIYIEEKYWDRLLELVKEENSLHTTLGYHSCLMKQYPDELISLYIPALKEYGVNSTGRSEYSNLVGIMKKIMKDIPQAKQKIQDVAKELKTQFSKKPRRQAMIEELDKIV